MKFLWTTLQVSDLDQSLAFYRNLLDLPMVERFQGNGNEIAMLGDADGTHLELLCKPGEKVESPGQGVSVGFAFDDLDAMADKLTAQGYQVSPPISPNPHLTFRFVADPDGYMVQLVAQG